MIPIECIQRFSLADRLFVSSGTISAERLPNTSHIYLKGAIVPNNPWTPIEASALTGPPHLCTATWAPASSGNRIRFFQLPHEHTAALCNASHRITNTAASPTLRDSDSVAAAVANFADTLQFSEYMASVAGGALDFFSKWKLGYWPPGRRTATAAGHSEGGQLVGLHIDTWTPRSTDLRDSAPYLISINIGSEAREFLFINLSISDLFFRLKAENRTDDMMFKKATTIPGRFLETFRAHPVIKVSLAPGEGYVAPVENMIHDASTERKALIDVFLVCRVFMKPAW